MWQENLIKDLQIGNEEIKLSLFANSMVVSVDTPKESPK